MTEKTRLAEIKVGAFVMAALLILVIGSLWVAGSLFFRGRQTHYWVLMKSAHEIEAGDRVRMAGVSIGRIHQVRLRPGEERPVAFRVVLDPDIPIRTDSTARIVTAGLLGVGSLQIEPGTLEAPLLEPGGEILGREALGLEEILARVDQISAQAVGGIDQMAAFMNQVSQEAGPLLGNIKVFFSEENAAHMRSILSTLKETLDQSGPRLSSLLARLDSISLRLDDELGDVPPTMEAVTVLATDLRAALGPDGSRLAGVLDRAVRALTSADSAMSVIDRHREELASAIRDLQETASNLKEFSQLIKEQPFRLIRINPEPDRRPGQGLREKRP